MATITDAENAFLEGMADVDEWRAAFEREWFAPLGEMMTQALVKSIPEEVKAGLDPQALAVLSASTGGE